MRAPPPPTACRRHLLPPQLLEAFKPLAEYVHASEPETLTYQMLTDDADPLACLILER